MKKPKKSRKILVTSALPYANGDIHIGHLVEYIQTDIWVRYQKLLGNECTYVCADDTHGTPIMLSAEKQGITPETLIEQMHTRHSEDFTRFFVDFDIFYTTHSPENKALSADIYHQLRKNGDIETRSIEQFFDPNKSLFLPDRYVKGECPRCHTPDQYGDNCEACGATYHPTDLKNPVSALSGATPIKKHSEHYFFKLENYQSFLTTWVESGHLQHEVANKLKEWFEAGLKSWDISRDAPYFGFEIPDAPNKYFYVWLDAPIGYMSSFKYLCTQRKDLDFNEYWNANTDTELYHFIGKDIVYFHGLFWPAILKAAGYRQPTAIYAHGFLTINGLKMSKSRGTFITARQFLEYLNPEYLRYYLAARLTNTTEDIDLNLEDFKLRVNAELVGKVVNIASRCASFITKHFDGKLSVENCEPELLQKLIDAGEEIGRHYESREYHKAIREIMLLADHVNQMINDKKPWQRIKETEDPKEVQAICTAGLNGFRLIMTYLKPILPLTAKNVEAFFNAPLDWQNRHQLLLNHAINPFKPLMQRIEDGAINALIPTA